MDMWWRWLGKVVILVNGDIFIMYMIKLKDLLVESQRFDIEGNKVGIIRTIDKIQKGDTLDLTDRNRFYSIVTNTGNRQVGVSKKMGYTDDDDKNWKEYFKSKAWNTDGVWSQRDINLDKKGKVDGKTYNYYITIDRNDRNNVVKFKNNIFKLDNSLKQFADNKGVMIKYKTHAILDMFLTHNDSLKVYYYDSSLKNDIESIVKKWISDNDIKTSDRSHTHGVDIEGRGSYGDIVAGVVLKTLIDTIKSHPKHSNEEYYQWLKKHFVDIIKNIKF